MDIQARLKHPAFPQPESPDIAVWRYMDLSKFIWLLQHQELYFSRLDHLQDPFEGSVTRKTVEGVAKFLSRQGNPEPTDQIARLFRDSRKSTYVNCWCALN